MEHVCVPSGLALRLPVGPRVTPAARHCLNSRYGQKLLLTHILEVLACLPETSFFWGRKGKEPSCGHSSLVLPRKY